MANTRRSNRTPRELFKAVYFRDCGSTPPHSCEKIFGGFWKWSGGGSPPPNTQTSWRGWATPWERPDVARAFLPDNSAERPPRKQPTTRSEISPSKLVLRTLERGRDAFHRVPDFSPAPSLNRRRATRKPGRLSVPIAPLSVSCLPQREKWDGVESVPARIGVRLPLSRTSCSAFHETNVGFTARTGS